MGNGRAWFKLKKWRSVCSQGDAAGVFAIPKPSPPPRRADDPWPATHMVMVLPLAVPLGNSRIPIGKSSGGVGAPRLHERRSRPGLTDTAPGDKRRAAERGKRRSPAGRRTLRGRALAAAQARSLGWPEKTSRCRCM